MKMIQVPAGSSEVNFRFSPTALRLSVAAGYFVTIVFALMWLLMRGAEQRSSQWCGADLYGPRGRALKARPASTGIGASAL